MSNVIEFPSHKARPPAPQGPSGVVEEATVRSPKALFSFTEHGQVDLAEGVSVTDAVTTFWEALQETVGEAWADHPLGKERARVKVLTAYLDRIKPEWREELLWSI